MKSDINITPLVDVVLVLLIIFMVVTPLLQRGYETKVPPKVTSNQPPPTNLDQIVVRLTEDGGMFINKEQYTERDFLTKLDELTKGRENKIVFFAADGNVSYDKVARFMDMCNDHGAKNLGIVLEDINPTATAGEAPK
ncbi:MAG TPA: biopolymer transporter ExbD [Thermoanaerobaculaceae bacterium]|nr:biopolymer transporter ExbD [Thermoanaerobaculaceae bacterium]